MMEKPRRSFLKRSAALVSGLAIAGCGTSEPGSESAAAPSSSSRALDPKRLETLARLVLPLSGLGDTGLRRVLDGFSKWLSELEPVAELDHAYIWTDEILYGPPDPAPLWASQLEALGLEAEKGHGASFEDLSPDNQRAILERQLPSELPPRLPEPARAPHVAIGLLAYFYNTAEANDLCYRAKIEKLSCRGIESGTTEPASWRS
jgi:hypothetical protein